MPDKPPSLETLLGWFKFAAEQLSSQREAELEQERFAAGDQWNEADRKSRNGTQSGNNTIGARPTLTIPLIDEPIGQVESQYDESEFGVTIEPDGDDASDEVAQVLQSLYQQIEQDSMAQAVRGWAVKRAVRVGRGWYRICTEYCNDGDDGPSAFDQEIRLKRILNQLSVYPDPRAENWDYSDMQFLIVTDDMPDALFKAEYPDAKLATMSDAQLASLGNELPGWVGRDEAKQTSTYRVAECWYVISTSEKLTDPADDKRTRTVMRRAVKCVKFCATDLLEEYDFDAPYIPIVAVTGREFNIGGRRKWNGMVEFAMDTQRAANVMASAAVEKIGLASKAPYLVADGQIEDFKGVWDTANMVNWTYLPYKTKDADGNVVGPPQRNLADVDISASVQMFGQFQNALRAVMGVPPTMSGMAPNDQLSGKALLELRRAGEHGTNRYLTNFVDVSLPYEAKVILALIPKVYDRPGRTLTLRDKSKKQTNVTIGENGIDFSQGSYRVTATVSKAFATRRQKAAEAMSDAITAAPQLLSVFGDLYFKNEDFADHEAISERMEAMLAPPIQAMIQQKGSGQPMPPAATAALAQAQGMIATLQQQLGMATQVIQTKQVESQANIQQTQMDNDTKVKIALINQSANLAAVDAKVDAENTRSFVDAMESRIGKLLDLKMAAIGQAHERITQAAEHAHDSALQAHTQAHDAAQAAVAAGQARLMQQAQAEHAAQGSPNGDGTGNAGQ